MFRLSLGSAAAVAIVAAMIIGAGGAWQIMRARETALADARSTARALSHSLAQHATRTVESVDIMLSGVVERVEGNPDRVNLKPYLERRAGALEEHRIVGIYDAQGMTVADSEPEHAPLSVVDRGYFEWHRTHADRQLHIDPLLVSKISGQPLIPLSRRIEAKEGGFAGLVVSALMPSDFQKFYDSMDIGHHGAVALWTGTGRILARRPEMPKSAVGRDFSTSDIALAFTRDASGVLVLHSPVDGFERIVAFEHLDTYPLVVSVGISTADALSRWMHDSEIEASALALACTTLLALAIAFERHRRALARSLESSQRADLRYRLLAQNASDLILLLPKARVPWFYVSPSSLDMLGWSPEALATLPTERFVRSDDLDRLRAEIASLSPDRPRLTSLYWLVHRDGHPVRIEALFQYTVLDELGESVIVSARDVTARHRTEEALKESEARYRLLADRSSDMVSRLALDASRLYVSPASSEILGYEPRVLLGTRPMDFIHPDEVERVADALARLGRGECDQARSLHRVHHAQGHWVWVEALFRLVRDPETQAPLEIVSSLRDVTVRHALQQQVQAGADLLQVTIESMEQGLVVVSADRTVRISNRRAAALLRSSPKEAPIEASEEPIVPPSLAGEDYDWLFGADGSMSDGHGERQIVDGPCLEIRRVAMADGGALLTLSDITHLKRAATQAHAANRLLVMAEEIAHVGHWSVDVLGSGRRIWSDEVFRIHGLPVAPHPPSREETIDLYHPDDRTTVLRDIRAAVAQRGTYEGSYRILLPGGMREVVTRGRCEVDRDTGEVTGLFGVIMDVTDLTRAQRELAEATAHLRITLDNMDQGLVKVARDGTIELFNRRFADLFDIPAALLEGPAPNFEDVLEHLAGRGEDAKTGTDIEAQIGRRVTPLTLGTYERERPSGQILEVRTVQIPDGTVVRTYADVTSRRRAEDAVRRSEAQYRMLADSTSDVITQLDLAYRRVYVSPASRAVFGYEPEELLGQRPSNFVHPDDAAAVRRFADDLVAGHISDSGAVTTYRFRHKKGHWVWIEAGLNLVRDAATGKPLSIICSLRDITERQRTARHLERAKAAAEKAARVKTEFLANMSHELRTPLTGILGVHDLLQADPTLSQQQKHHLGLARDAGRILLAIVNDVLDLTKMETGQFTLESVSFDVIALIESCRDLALPEADRKTLSVELTVPDTPLTIDGDPTRLRQIVTNLVTNAIKFTEHGGVKITVSSDRDRGRFRVDVADTGIGIATDKLPFLFERFTQADSSVTRRYGGTGLGLAICKRLVDLMGGALGVESELGHGTLVWFELPLVEAVRVLAESGDAMPPPAKPSRSRVLLAEDNDINRDIISAMLEKQGHEVVVVADGAAAVAAVRAGPAFSIVLMDLQMPVMDGLSATRAIRKAEAGAKPTPIVGLTANAMAEDIARCRDAGMDSHVAKPIEWGILFAAIDKIASRSDTAGALAVSHEHGGLDVLNEAILEALAGYIGRDKLEQMLAAFTREVEARVSAFEALPPAEIAARAHALVSLAGQLGFMELSRLCAEMEVAAREGTRPVRIDVVQTAANRAIRAARNSKYAKAA